jgi:phosphate transport system substrate-binding protein
LVRGVSRWWFPVAGAAIGATLALAALVAAELAGPRPPSGRQVPPTPLGRGDGTVHLAGTGTWLPLAQVLASAFERGHPGPAVIVHESIGSRGGRQAVADGAVDIGLVAHEVGAPPEVDRCTTIVVARAAVVFAVHRSVPATSISREEVVAIFSGQTTRWRDGSVVVPLLRESGDSATRVAGAALPGFGDAVRAGWERGRWPTFLTDADMGRALAATPGAIGLYDLGAILIEGLPVTPLALDGVAPSEETLAAGRWTLARELSLVVGPSPSARARAFVDFVGSAEARALISELGGYVPLTGEAP